MVNRGVDDDMKTHPLSLSPIVAKINRKPYYGISLFLLPTKFDKSLLEGKANVSV